MKDWNHHDDKIEERKLKVVKTDTYDNCTDSAPPNEALAKVHLGRSPP